MSALSSFQVGGEIVYFSLWVGNNGRVPDWPQQQYYVATDVIPGSNPPIVERGLIAIGDVPPVVWNVGFDSRDDLRRLRAMVWSHGTLSVPMNVQSHIGAPEQRVDGLVEHLPNTLLVDIDNVVTHVDGTVDADLHFQRLLNPATGEAIL